MIDPHRVYEGILHLLDAAGIEYRLYHHRPVLSYVEADLARAESGFEGTEGKVVVCRVDEGFAVYVTTQGRRLDQRAVKRLLDVTKLRLATAEELRDRFGAEPSCDYPFGFAPEIPIVIDVAIYDEDWLLFSPALPTTTIQLRGRDLHALTAGLPNPILEHVSRN